MDFATDENGDIAIKNGDFYFVTGVDATVQFLTQRLNLWLSEWFLDETLGIPFLDDVFIKNPNPVLLNSIFKNEIINSPGILELTSFNLSIDKPTRQLTISGSMRALDGDADFSIPIVVPGGA